MIRSLTLISALAVVTTIATAQVPAFGGLRRLESNAGTGPFQINLQSGLTDDGSGGRSGANIRIGSIYEQIGNILRSGSLSGIQDLLDRLNERSLQSLEILVVLPHPSVNKDLIALLDRTGTKPLADIQTEVDDTTKSLYSAANDDFGRFARTKFGAVNSGIFVGRDTSCGFSSLTYSPGESGSKDHRVAGFVEAAGLVPLDGSGASATGRFGAGLAFGDPHHYVFAISAASYVDPSALDAEVSGSVRLEGGHKEEGLAVTPFTTLGAVESALAPKIREPILLDHVRSGDLWFGGGFRSISNSTSDALANGQMWEGTLTYAIREPTILRPPFRNPVPSTTLTVSGIYSAQRALGVNELGAEVRTPLEARLRYATPVFFSFRYGTRGNFTFGIDARF